MTLRVDLFLLGIVLVLLVGVIFNSITMFCLAASGFVTLIVLGFFIPSS